MTVKAGVSKMCSMNVLRLEKLLRDLVSCGVRLAPGVEAKDLVDLLDSGFDYEELLTVLGDEADTPDGYWSQDLWHFDPECIAGGDDYVAIAERFRSLARGELPLDHIQARADAAETWIAFELDGEEYRWEALFDDDWADPGIIRKFADLLDSRGYGRRFTMLDLGGQDCLIGCATAQEFSRLRLITGLDFCWLSSQPAALGIASSASPAAREVSDKVLLCEHRTDWVGAAFKFACGAVVGFILGFLGSVRFLRNEWTVPVGVVFGVICAVIAGVLALRV